MKASKAGGVRAQRTHTDQSLNVAVPGLTLVAIDQGISETPHTGTPALLALVVFGCCVEGDLQLAQLTLRLSVVLGVGVRGQRAVSLYIQSSLVKPWLSQSGRVERERERERADDARSCGGGVGNSETLGVKCNNIETKT
jgi:hypothetical protein